METSTSDTELFKKYLKNPINKTILYKNIVKQIDFEIYLPANKLLTKDIYNFDIFRLDLDGHGLSEKNISSIKIDFISKNLHNETINNFLLNTKYNLSVGESVILYDNFIQNKNLLMSDIILPIKSIYYHSVYINIINIKKLLSILDNLEIKISLSEVIFNKEIEDNLQNTPIEQLIERDDETFNLFRIGSGMGSNAYQMYLPIDNEKYKIYLD